MTDFAALLAQADDLATQHLGQVVSYTSEGGQTVSIRGVFDAAYVLVDAGQAGVSSCSPAVFVRAADLPTNPSEDEPTVEVGGVTYRVREVKPDGLGGILLVLHEA